MNKNEIFSPEELENKIVTANEKPPIPMSGFSEMGKATLNNMSNNPVMYANFLKMQGRMFKFPATVALEFFSHSDKTDCIATEGQWRNLGYRLKTSADAIRFIDSKGNIHSYYDFSQIENAEFFPKRWEITQENVSEVKDYLRANYSISDGNPNTPIISMMLYCTNIFLDANKCMESLNVPESEKTLFWRNYVNAFSLIVAGRLEVNAVRPFNITPDMSFISTLEKNSDKLLFLSYAGRTAREALKIIERAVATYDEKRRDSNELRNLEEPDIRTEIPDTRDRISDNSSKGNTETRSDRNDNNLQSAKTASGSTLEERNGDRENGTDITVLENQAELASQAHNDDIRVQSGEQHILSSNDGHRTVDGGRTNRSLRTEMDAYDGGELLRRDGMAEISAQVPERSEGSEQNGRGIQGHTGTAVRETVPTSDRLIRSDSELGTDEAVRNGQSGNEGSGTTPLHRENSGEINTEKESSDEQSNGSFLVEENTISSQQVQPEPIIAHSEKTEWQESDNSPQLSLFDLPEEQVKTESAEMSFAEQVDKALNNELNRYSDLKVCDTPEILLSVGCEQLPILYTQSHLRDALKPHKKKGEGIHHHELTTNLIKQIPNALAHPVCIYDSLSRSDSIVILTDLIDNRNNPIVAVIKPNGTGKYNLDVVSSNFMLSIYGRENIVNQLNNAVLEKKLLYIDKNKSQELFRVLGLQLSQGVNNLDFNIIIHQSHNIVKANAEEKIELSVNNEVSVAEKSEIKSNSYAHRLYKAFTEQFPDIVNGNHSYERYGNEYIEDGDNDALEPLSIEHLGGNRYGFMYWYVQNGDLMRDPDFTFDLDHKKQELIIQEYQLDGSPIGSVYYSVFNENGEPDRRLLASLNQNFLQILETNKAMERKQTAFTTKDGEEIVVPNIDSHNTEEIIISDEEVITEAIAEDKSAEWREVLNDYSRKHGLGELNLIPPKSEYGIDTAWTLKEKMIDGNEIQLMTFNSYVHPIFSNASLADALDNYDKRNSDIAGNYKRRDIISNYNNRISPLPEPKNLPVIEYADKPRERINDNILALRELKRLEERAKANLPLYRIEDKEHPDYYISTNTSITKKQSDNYLRKYYGWGGLSQVFDERFKNHQNTRNEIKELIGEDAYSKARRSTLNAFYTPQLVVDAMYKAIINMELPTDAKILEPSCGTGNFITRLPSRYRKAEITGVEIDETTAKIASYLANDNQNVRILNMGFEKTNFENNSFDLVIGNVPFGENKLIDTEYKKDLMIHDSFFRKAIDKVKKGGIVAFITTSGTLDKKNSKIREMLAEKSDLVGAVRLPNNTFDGTNVTTDIIFLQKRENPLQPFDKKPDWCYTSLNDDGLRINSYFIDNPKMILGKMEKTSFYDRLTCKPIENADEKVLSFGEIMAVAEGNPLFKQLASKKNEMIELKMLYGRYQNETADMRNELPRMKEKLVGCQSRLNSLNADLKCVSDKFEIKDSLGNVYSETKNINVFLNNLVRDKWRNPDSLSSFKVGEFNVDYELPKYVSAPAAFTINNHLQYTIELKSQPDFENLDTTLATRLKNFFETGLEKRIINTEQEIKDTEMNINQTAERIAQPFGHLNELEKLEKEVESLTEQIYKEQQFGEKSETVADKNEVINKEDIIDYSSFDDSDYGTPNMTM